MDRREGDAVCEFVRDFVEAPPPKGLDALKSATEMFVKVFRSEREERVRVRAYFLWLEQGRPEGRALEFWDAASAEIDEHSASAEK